MGNTAANLFLHVPPLVGLENFPPLPRGGIFEVVTWRVDGVKTWVLRRGAGWMFGAFFLEGSRCCGQPSRFRGTDKEVRLCDNLSV
jgi:hypothetical protein